MTPAPEDFCRALEAYLCRKNDGHLIRIVGPAFEQVTGWARQGIPLKVAESGIDRCFERYYRRGPRRRPVRIEFCEADVLDAFDDWRRAVGVASVRADAAGGAEVEEPPAAARGRRSLAAHIESAIARLTALCGGGRAPLVPSGAVDAAIRALDVLKADAGRARGAARESIIGRLAAIDAELVGAAAAGLADADRAGLERDVAGELAPFRARMDPGAYARAARVALERQVRQRAGLPEIAFE
jgi:hypothetical protein